MLSTNYFHCSFILNEKTIMILQNGIKKELSCQASSTSKI